MDAEAAGEGAEEPAGMPSLSLVVSRKSAKKQRAALSHFGLGEG